MIKSLTSNRLTGVTCGNNTFVAFTESGGIVRSTDNGSSWDNVTREIPANDWYTWNVGFQE